MKVNFDKLCINFISPGEQTRESKRDLKETARSKRITIKFWTGDLVSLIKKSNQLPWISIVYPGANFTRLLSDLEIDTEDFEVLHLGGSVLIKKDVVGSIGQIFISEAKIEDSPAFILSKLGMEKMLSGVILENLEKSWIIEPQLAEW